MNYCTKCSSYYQTPGTCNCYAAAQPGLYPIAPQPWRPSWVPYQPYPWPWGTTGTMITVTPKPGDGTTWYTITNNEGSYPVTSGYSHIVT